MRTKTAVLCAAALAAGAMTSMAQNVYSLNVVGYVNRVSPGTVAGVQQLSFVANPLDSGANIYSNLFQAMPVGTTFSKWNPGAGIFSTVSRAGFGTGWSPSGAWSTTLNPGEGVFIKLPLNSTGWTNTFVGNVLQDSSGNPAGTNTLLVGYTAASYVVPVADSLANLGLNAALPASPSGSKVQLWNESSQIYNTFSRASFGSGWSPSVPSNTVGSAFFVFNAASTNRNWVIDFTVQ